MARMLSILGLFLLAAVACLLLAEEMAWMTTETADALVQALAVAGVACLMLGAVSSLLRPVSRAISQGRCVRCGRPIERGQTYCRDHLQATVNEYRDQTRAGLH